MEGEHQPVGKSELWDGRTGKLATPPLALAHAHTHRLCPPSIPCGPAHGAVCVCVFGGGGGLPRDETEKIEQFSNARWLHGSLSYAPAKLKTASLLNKVHHGE